MSSQVKRIINSTEFTICLFISTDYDMFHDMFVDFGDMFHDMFHDMFVH